MPVTLRYRLSLAVAALATVATATTFAPWGSSGERSRSSHQLVEVADRAGIVADSAARAAVVWHLLPVLCGVVLLAVAVHRVRFAAVAAATLGALVTTGAVLVARSPLLVEPGAILGGAAGGGTFLAATAVVLTAGKAEAADDRPVGSER